MPATGLTGVSGSPAPCGRSGTSATSCSGIGTGVGPTCSANRTASSASDGQRSSGAFASMRATSRSTAAGTSGRSARSGGGASRRCASSTSACVPTNGGRPVSSWCATAPRAYWSDAPVTWSFAYCSGLMYSGVPIASPVFVSRCPSVTRAMPKSVTIARPQRRSIMTFDGFTSRCTTPISCAYASAHATSASRWQATGTGSGPRARCICSSEQPSMKRITKKRSPSCSPAKYTGTMFGWSSIAAVRASPMKRCGMTAEYASSGSMTFSATGRGSRRSAARNTAAMPPRPISRATSYSLASAARTRTSSGSSAAVVASTAPRRWPQAGQKRTSAAAGVPHRGQCSIVTFPMSGFPSGRGAPALLAARRLRQRSAQAGPAQAPTRGTRDIACRGASTFGARPGARWPALRPAPISPAVYRRARAGARAPRSPPAVMTSRRDFLATTSAAVGGALGAALLGGCARRPGTVGATAPIRPAAKPMDLLVLGGTGFIGPHLVRHAVARGHRVTIFTRGRRDRRSPGVGRRARRRSQRAARRPRERALGRRRRRLRDRSRLGAPVDRAAEGARRPLPVHVVHGRLLPVPHARHRRVDAGAARRRGPQGRLGDVRGREGAVRADHAGGLRRSRRRRAPDVHRRPGRHDRPLPVLAAASGPRRRHAGAGPARRRGAARSTCAISRRSW